MDGKPPRILSLVLVPAAITLVVTVLRLVGELQGWSPTLFSKEGGGGGAIVGIGWLIFVFGLWFGIRLQRGGAPIHKPGKALLLSLLALGVLMAGMMACKAADLIAMPDPEHPVTARGAPWLLAVLVLGLLVSLLAWRRAALTLFVYAVLARIPVVILTWIGLQRGWETHYTRVGVGFLPPPQDELLPFLLLPQVTFWPAITVMLGTVMASLGALFAGRPKA